MRKTAVLAVCAVVAGTAGLLAAQTALRPQPTFRAEINSVEVDVIVTDAAGRFVPGLTAADFQVLDEGRPQKIELFQEVNVPIAPAADAALSGTRSSRVAPDVVSNIEAAEGRLYLLLLDDLHIAPLNTNLVKQRAREFVEGYVGENDQAAIMFASGRAGDAQDFTSNRALLLAAIDRLSGRGLPSAFESRAGERDDGIDATEKMRIARGPARERDARQRLIAARATFSTVRDVAAGLSAMSGRRKALLLFSEGIAPESDGGGGGPLSPRFGEAQEARAAMAEAIAVATRANVHVYAIDASRIRAGGIGADQSITTAAAGIGRGDAENLGAEAIAAERRRAIGTLRNMAEQTGGIAIVDTANFANGYARIQRENSSYYVLGFYPTTARDGKFHRLDVRVARPGLRAQSRAGFYAANATDPAVRKSGADRDPMAALLTAPLPSSGLPMRLALPVFRKSRGEATVLMAVDVPPGVLRFEHAGAAFAEDFHIVYQVIGPPSKIVTSARQDLEMRLRAETRAMVDARGFRAVFPVTVKPGRYQVRLAATAKNGARTGSVFADLEVPDFFRERLVWSSVVLTSELLAAVPTRPAGEGTATMIPLMPAAVRRFTPDDTLGVFAELYDNGARGPDAIELTAEVRDAAGAIVFAKADQRTGAAARTDRGGHGFSVDIPLTGLRPGSYVLTLSARSHAAANAAATRHIAFAISLEP